jgi:hypothetical protein
MKKNLSGSASKLKVEYVSVFSENSDLDPQ